MANLFKCGNVTLDGNATAANVLSGKTFYKDDANAKLTGSMTNNGAVSKTLTTSTKTYTVPAGYHNGSGTVSITTETKTVAPASGDITPSSGKVLSKVTINAPVEKTATQSVTVSANSSSTVTFTFSGISTIFGITQISKASGGSQYLNIVGAYPSSFTIPSSISSTSVKLLIVNNSDASATASFTVKVKGPAS